VIFLIIAVGSKNPVKINAVKKALENYYDDFEIISFDSVSGVPDQPFGDDTQKGAFNRVQYIKNITGADLYFGIEAGIKKKNNKFFLFTVVYCESIYGMSGYSVSPVYELPEKICNELGNNELGTVMEKFTGTRNIKQKGGAIEFFSKGILTREQIYIPAVISSLIPINNIIYYDYYIKEYSCLTHDITEVLKDSAGGCEYKEKISKLRDKAVFYTLEFNGYTLGAAAFILQTKEIKYFSVIPLLRKCGIGRTLIKFITDKHGKNIFLFTDDDSHDFYIKCGFKTSDEFFNSYGTKKYRMIF